MKKCSGGWGEEDDSERFVSNNGDGVANVIYTDAPAFDQCPLRDDVGSSTVGTVRQQSQHVNIEFATDVVVYVAHLYPSDDHEHGHNFDNDGADA